MNLLLLWHGKASLETALHAYLTCFVMRSFSLVLFLLQMLRSQQLAARPAELDHIKATGKTKIDAVYADMHKSHKMWVKNYKNPFVGGLFYEDLGAIQPHLATFKDGEAIWAVIWSTVQKVETILKDHKQSRHHSSSDDRLLEIKNSFITHKGRNVDISIQQSMHILCKLQMTQNIVGT
jgi:hypothetical protein